MKSLKEKVNDYQIKPNQRVWATIEKELDQQEKKGFFFILKPYRNLMAAASILLVIGFYTMTFWYGNNENKAQMAYDNLPTKNEVKADNSNTLVVNTPQTSSVALNGNNELPQSQTNKVRAGKRVKKDGTQSNSFKALTTINNDYYGMAPVAVSVNSGNNSISDKQLKQDVALAKINSLPLQPMDVEPIDMVITCGNCVRPKIKFNAEKLKNEHNYTYTELIIAFADKKAKAVVKEKIQPALRAYITDIGQN